MFKKLLQSAVLHRPVIYTTAFVILAGFVWQVRAMAVTCRCLVTWVGSRTINAQFVNFIVHTE